MFKRSWPLRRSALPANGRRTPEARSAPWQPLSILTARRRTHSDIRMDARAPLGCTGIRLEGRSPDPERPSERRSVAAASQFGAWEERLGRPTSQRATRTCRSWMQHGPLRLTVAVSRQDGPQLRRCWACPPADLTTPSRLVGSEVRTLASTRRAILLRAGRPYAGRRLRS